jgi:hypothetical protein
MEASDILGLNELENSDLLKTSPVGDDDFSFDLASKSSLLFMASSNTAPTTTNNTNNNNDSDTTLSTSNNLNNSNSNSSLNNKLITGNLFISCRCFLLLDYLLSLKASSVLFLSCMALVFYSAFIIEK